MPGNMLKLGPFKGGLNNASDPTSIKDTELAECINWDFDTDGTLTSRPPFVTDSVSGPTASENVDLLGYYVSSAGASYLIGSTSGGVYYFASGAWTLITNTFQCMAAVQYLDKMWLVPKPGSTNPGGSWDHSTGFSAVASMPQGSAITVFKERLWIAAGKLETTNGSRLYFSEIADGTTWNTADFIDINKGDGQKLVDIYTISTNLFLLKENSTYVLQYDSGPSGATVNSISKTIGVQDIRCVAQYENILYVLHQGFLYELINYSYTKTNIRLSITDGASGTYSSNTWVALVGNRVLVFYYGNLYVFFLFTRTWSKWETSVPVARLYYVPNSSDAGAIAEYKCNSNSVSDEDTFTFFDGYDVSNTESNVTVSLATKIYDFNMPNLFKRLFWWGIDIKGEGTFDTAAVPVIYSYAVTWAEMASFTWGEVSSNTWDRPSEKDISVTDSVVTYGTARKFLKVLKAVRFRNIYFTVSATVEDWLNPIRVYAVTPVISVRQQVTKDVN